MLFWCYENLDHIKDISSGSTFAEISKKAYPNQSVPVVVPSDTRPLVAHEGLVRPLYDRKAFLTTRRNRFRFLYFLELAKTRDFLLPKLMSGEIRLTEAEKAVEAVA